MANPQQSQAKETLLAKVPKGHLFYPLVFVNGEYGLSGGADHYQVVYALQQMMPSASRG